MKKIFNKKNLIIAVSTYVVVMIVGFVYDLNISKLLYNGESSFVTFVEKLGAFPEYVLGSVGSMFVLLGDNKTNRDNTLIRYAVASIGFGESFIYSIKDSIDNHLDAVEIVLLCLVIIGICLACYFAFKKRSKEYLTRTGLMLVMTVFLEFCFVFGCKFLFSRPRYEFVVAEGEEYFRRVFSFDNSLKKQFVELGVSSDMFKAFPSGHASHSATLVLLSIFFKKKSKLVVDIGIVYSIFVGLTRIIAGAHFLSDVATGIFATYIAFYISGYLLYVLFDKVKFNE